MKDEAVEGFLHSETPRIKCVLFDILVLLNVED